MITRTFIARPTTLQHVPARPFQIFADAGFQPVQGEPTEEDQAMRRKLFALRREAAPPRDAYIDLLSECGKCTDLSIVQQVYSFAREAGVLKAFGSFSGTLKDAPRGFVDVADMQRAGIPLAACTPKKSRGGTLAALAVFGAILALTVLRQAEVESALLSVVMAIPDARPFFSFLLSAFIIDRFWLGGAASGELGLRLNAPYRTRVARHEAGHLLLAYLLGCPIRDYVLSPWQALLSGIPGQAGVQFWDAELDEQLRRGTMRASTLDRYSVVLFGGIAAEALAYGSSEGGTSDELALQVLVAQMQPPWSYDKLTNQARWAVLRAVDLLRRNAHVHDRLVDAMLRGLPLRDCIELIEATVVPPTPGPASPAPSASPA